MANPTQTHFGSKFSKASNELPVRPTALGEVHKNERGKFVIDFAGDDGRKFTHDEKSLALAIKHLKHIDLPPKSPGGKEAGIFQDGLAYLQITKLQNGISLDTPNAISVPVRPTSLGEVHKNDQGHVVIDFTGDDGRKATHDEKSLALAIKNLKHIDLPLTSPGGKEAELLQEGLGYLQITKLQNGIALDTPSAISHANSGLGAAQTPSSLSAPSRSTTAPKGP